MRPSTDRWTTPPADVARAVRRMGTPTPLSAAGARQPERERGTASGQARCPADRRESEAAGLRAERAHAGNECRGASGVVVDRPQPVKTESRPMRRRATRAEVNRRVGDEAGHQTHSHARHCTPAPCRRKAHYEFVSRGRTDTAPRPRRSSAAGRTAPHLRVPVAPSNAAALHRARERGALRPGAPGRSMPDRLRR